MAIFRVPTAEYPHLKDAYNAAASYGDTIIIEGDYVNPDYPTHWRKLVNLIRNPDAYLGLTDGFKSLPKLNGKGIQFSAVQLDFQELPIPPTNNYPLLFEGINVSSVPDDGIALMYSVNDDLSARLGQNVVEMIFHRCYNSYGTGSMMGTTTSVSQPRTGFNFHFKNCESYRITQNHTPGLHENSSFIVEKCLVGLDTSLCYFKNTSDVHIIDVATTPTAGYGVGEADGSLYGESLLPTIIDEQFWSVSGQIQNIPVGVDVADFKVLLFREHPLQPNFPFGPLKTTSLASDGSWSFQFLDLGYRYGVMINPPDGMKGHWLKWYTPVAPAG